MHERGMRVAVLVYVALAACAFPCVAWGGALQESLVLRPPGNVQVIPQMDPSRIRFVNYIVWDNIPLDQGTFIHQPDTAQGWNSPQSQTPQASLTVPTSSGEYLGTIDRTVAFRAQNNGTVGSASPLAITYEIVAEEEWNYAIDIGQGYVPGTQIRCIFTNQSADTLDLGLNLQFSDGVVDSNGTFIVGMEDFEGFHVWRGIKSDGSDLTILGEMSKQEQFAAAPFDSLYFSEIIPALRATGVYNLPVPVPGLGSAIDVRTLLPGGRLGANQFIWFDLNAFNGFTYYYAATTFDRGYSVRSHSQGLFKFDNCQPMPPDPFECQQYLVATVTEVTPQNDLQQIYAVPNPYRSGSSRFSADNYHNFPDNKMRFVNVPQNCKFGIYTPAGDLVWFIGHSSSSGNIEWDTRNSSGELVSSGIYIYRVETPDGNGVFGRIVIIR